MCLPGGGYMGQKDLREKVLEDYEDKCYKDIKQELTKMEKEGRPVTMCNVAQALEEKGIEKGKLIQLIELVKTGDLSIEIASQKMGMTIDLFKEEIIKIHD